MLNGIIIQTRNEYRSYRQEQDMILIIFDVDVDSIIDKESDKEHARTATLSSPGMTTTMRLSSVFFQN